MIIHYNCTIGSFLLHSFLLIYPPSFHEMLFTLVYIAHSGRPVIMLMIVDMPTIAGHRLLLSSPNDNVM